jgi:TPR repeat protein
MFKIGGAGQRAGAICSRWLYYQGFGVEKDINKAYEWIS